MSQKRVLEAIKRNKRFLISAHVNLEGDALGAELALARLLHKKGKKAFVVNADKSPHMYSFLPGVSSILRPKDNIPDYDVFIAVDCCDKNRLGKVTKLINKNKTTINIDHHRGNDNFADINWVAADVSSASEMIYQLYKQLNVKIDEASALLIYVGILIDTGSFRYSNTNAETHRIAADLLSKNLSANKIYQKIYEANPLEETKALIKIISEFQTDNKSEIAWVEIKSGVLNTIGLKIDLTDNIFNFLRSIDGIEVSIIFKEINSRETRVNFRSKGKLDVAKLARGFGGGGHRSASGCSISKGLQESKRIVLNKLRKLL